MWLLFSACALLTPHTQPPRHTHPRPRLLPAVMVAGSGREGGGDIDVQRDPPDKLLDLVVQCAVQAQLAYHNEFKSEVRAKWLESFLGHEYLHVERIGGRESRMHAGLEPQTSRPQAGLLLTRVSLASDRHRVPRALRPQRLQLARLPWDDAAWLSSGVQMPLPGRHALVRIS